uniref:hypothetical protein n=1 Tax=Pararhizobium sp. IMCC3301 TaxID=3067904 RepID=UPI002740FE95|nr:hypothetical protein [Pararhizobium sp. IMCC3301]
MKKFFHLRTNEDFNKVRFDLNEALANSQLSAKDRHNLEEQTELILKQFMLQLSLPNARKVFSEQNLSGDGYKLRFVLNTEGPTLLDKLRKLLGI